MLHFDMLTFIAIAIWAVVAVYTRSRYLQISYTMAAAKRLGRRRRIQCLERDGVDYTPRLVRAQQFLVSGAIVALVAITIPLLVADRSAIVYGAYGVIMAVVLVWLLLAKRHYTAGYKVYVSHLRRKQLAYLAEQPPVEPPLWRRLLRLSS